MFEAEGWPAPLRRVFRREGNHLIIEESGGAGKKTIAYYLRS